MPNRVPRRSWRSWPVQDALDRGARGGDAQARQDAGDTTRSPARPLSLESDDECSDEVRGALERGAALDERALDLRRIPVPVDEGLDRDHVRLGRGGVGEPIACLVPEDVETLPRPVVGTTARLDALEPCTQQVVLRVHAPQALLEDDQLDGKRAARCGGGAPAIVCFGDPAGDEEQGLDRWRTLPELPLGRPEDVRCPLAPGLRVSEELLQRQPALADDAAERPALQVAGVHRHRYAQGGVLPQHEMAAGLVMSHEPRTLQRGDDFARSYNRESRPHVQLAREICRRSLRGGTFTSGGSGSPSATRLSQKARMASSAMARASSSVSPSVMQPGRAGTVTV